MINKRSRICVLCGGPSREADVSRNTGKAVYQALTSLGYQAELVEYKPSQIARELAEKGIDAVFLALHGKFGEDGTIQGMLELLQIPYTGSGVTSSAITMDKIMSAHVFQNAGIPMARSMPFYKKDGIDRAEKEITASFSFPVVLKPACEGSTIGIEIVKDKSGLRDALSRVFQVEPRILAESYLDGEEFTVSVLDGKAFPVIHIRPHSGAYDYYSKYTRGATDYIVPADIPQALAEEMAQISLCAYKAAECAGAVRFDFRTDREGRPFLLEANSIPGMTETSLVPKAARAAGLDFPHLCEKILLGASLGKV